MSDQVPDAKEENSQKDTPESKYIKDVLIDVVRALKETADNNDSFMREVIDKNEKKERRQ